MGVAGELREADLAGEEVKMGVFFSLFCKNTTTKTTTNAKEEEKIQLFLFFSLISEDDLLQRAASVRRGEEEGACSPARHSTLNSPSTKTRP